MIVSPDKVKIAKIEAQLKPRAEARGPPEEQAEAEARPCRLAAREAAEKEALEDENDADEPDTDEGTDRPREAELGFDIEPEVRPQADNRRPPSVPMKPITPARQARDGVCFRASVQTHGAESPPSLHERRVSPDNFPRFDA